MGEYLYGLDLSMSQTGITVFDLNTYNPVLTTSIKTKPKLTYGERLKQVTDVYDELIEKYPPGIVAIEKGFTNHNKATQVIYRTHGIANRWFYEAEQHEYAPTSVKATILGGKSSKEEIRQKIEQKYPGVEFKNEDESDSFAVALTYLIKNKLIEWDKKLKS